MSSLQDRIRVMEMLAVNEETVSRLYRIYADKFPEQSNFWAGLALEETDHARWIRDVEERVKEGKVYFDDTRINIDTVKLSIDTLNGQIAKAQTRPLMLRDALFFAADQENALLESKWFYFCEGDSLEFKRLVADLDAATTRHRDELTKFLSEAKQERSC